MEKQDKTTLKWKTACNCQGEYLETVLRDIIYNIRPDNENKEMVFASISEKMGFFSNLIFQMSVPKTTSSQEVLSHLIQIKTEIDNKSRKNIDAIAIKINAKIESVSFSVDFLFEDNE